MLKLISEADVNCELEADEADLLSSLLWSRLRHVADEKKDIISVP